MTTATEPDRRRSGVRSWGLWAAARPALVLILTVDLCAAAAITMAVLASHPTDADWVHLGLLAALAGVYAEATDRVDRLRRYLATSSGSMANTTSVWCFAAALVLPAGPAVLLTLLIFAHTLLRAHRHRAAKPHRLIFTAATMVLAVIAARGVLTGLAPAAALLTSGGLGVLALAAALAVFQLVNQGIVAGIVYLVTHPRRFRDALLSREDLTLEIATLALAVLTAETLLHAAAYTPLALILIVVLHRSSLVRQLQVAASTDAKTGLLNLPAWRDQAHTHLTGLGRPHRRAAVLIVDLDYFKAVNDTYGHPTGDAALAAVAGCLRREVRPHDVVGRYGGEEFVVYLDDTTPADALTAAHRLCDRVRSLTFEVANLTVTASVGVACYPGDGSTLDALITAADRSLYQAKNLGRNQAHRAI